MMPAVVPSRAESLRLAVESGDFSAADAALGNYLTWFQSAPRNLAEVAEARDLLDWAVEVAKSRKADISQELGRVTAFFAAYGPRRISHSWKVTG